jgi:hypothetical protein
VLVEDFVAIHQQDQAARAAILRDRGAWMTPLASRALTEGAAVAQPGGPFSRVFPDRGTLVLSLGSVRTRLDSTLISIAWTAAPESSGPLLEGDLELSPLDQEHSHMSLVAHFRLDEQEAPPSARSHARRCAQVTVRSFLREVGRQIERRPAR